MTTAQEVLRSTKGLPTLSAVVVQLAELLNDETAGAKEFERIVKPDASLTSNLLRLANSPFFGARREITSVRQAIALLGVTRVFELATSASFAKVVPRRIPGFEIEADDFFLHSMAVGVMAEALSSKKRPHAKDMTFTAGLLHDIGKLAIGSLLLSELEEHQVNLTQDDETFVKTENRMVGTNHSEVGELIVEEWSLPKSFGVVARWHHQPDETPTKEEQNLVDLVHVADCLAHMMGFGVDLGELKRKISKNAVTRLNVKVQDLEKVALETTDQIKEMGKIFGGTP